MCCLVDITPETGTIQHMLAVNWKCGDERREGESFQPPVYSRKRLRARLRDLRVFVEAVTESMDALEVPRNHRTLEMEYRRLRSQLHQGPADGIIRQREGDKTIMNWVDLRSRSQLLIQTYNASVGAKERKPQSNSFVVKGRDLCRSADDVATKMRQKLTHIGRHQGNASRQSVYLTQPDPSTVSLIKTSPESTVRIAKHKDRNVISFKKRDIFNTSESLTDEESRSSKSNSKGRRVHFAPDAEDIASRDPAGSVKGRREKVRISISNVSTNYVDEGPPRLHYTTQGMALLPVRMMREISWDR